MRKIVFCLSILILLAGLIAGCGSQESSTPSDSDVPADEQVTITYFTFSPGEGHEQALQAMIEAFEAKHPNIKIKYEMASFQDYFTRLQTQIAGGNAPDTFELNYENFVSYAAKGALLELDELIANDHEFDPGSLNQRAYEAFQYNGKQYGMVESFSNVVLFYNKDLFDEAGVEYPQPDWTWADELEAAQQLTNHEEGIWGTYAPVQFWEFYKTIAQNGGAVFNEDKTEVTLHTPENVEALQWMIDKIHKYKVTPSDADMSGQSDGDLFKAGKIAMLRTGIWMFDSFKDAPFDWDIVLEPGNTQKAHHFFANGLAISKDSEHPEAAWEWIKFMSASQEAAQIRVDAAWELPAVSEPSLVEDYLQQTPPESRHIVFEALDTLVVPPVIERWSEMTDMIDEELDRVKLGQKTPDEALANAEKKLKELLD
ncbi:multiple sugar transport system substrate-binding protein [Caldalkalibacillus uzonensis]|uniref:Multiple sugar transport system substrate-binding protein n=1 Tax=Caldalkalibacillus uzonensis TaxID=353224 RepID=A0ABU0CQW3_9BACI|nr:sugar ABC transporter substrate-binding protein [Caldalkalibacillus uzonensis]MDQ0338463.1 multiple sugar transport system substrate-binding protein [Caldalkalibacillus uzonensis]